MPVEIKEMVTKLPRSFNNMDTVQIKLKRHIQHIGDYMFESVRPKLTLSAAEYLCKQQKIKEMRKTTGNDGRKFRAKDCLNKDFADNIVKYNEGYRSLKFIRGTPAHWEHIRKINLAMIRQISPPTFFITLSPVERIWLELIQVLYKYHHGKQLTLDEVSELDDDVITDLIRKDPVMCARYFQNKTDCIMKALKKKGGIFDEFEVSDFYIRGSPHLHILLYMKDAPKFDVNDRKSRERCENLIDRFITCAYDPDNPYIQMQMHIHTHTCDKNQKKSQKKGKGKEKIRNCRFGIPLPVMNRTRILSPLDPIEY